MQPSVVIEPRTGFFRLDLNGLWQYRELVYFLVWREIKVRYKQTLLGVTWVILQPLVTIVIFTFIFGRFAKIPSDDLPYPIFVYSALLPWSYFAGALQRSSESVVSDAHLITKIYFPRLILPLAGAISGVIDFAISFVLFLGMMVWYGYQPSHLLVALLVVPALLLLALFTALAVGLWLSALNVRFRDIKHTIPFLVQIWMFLSPVVYPVAMIPEKYRLIYGLNPMVGVIEGFRWVLLGKASVDFSVLIVGGLVVIVLFSTGLIYFKNVERTFADVV